MILHASFNSPLQYIMIQYKDISFLKLQMLIIVLWKPECESSFMWSCLLVT